MSVFLIFNIFCGHSVPPSHAEVDSPAACFSRIFFASSSRSRCISLPVLPLAFFYRREKKFVSHGSSVFSIKIGPLSALETTYLAGRGLEVLLASLVALVAASHGDERLVGGEKREEENERMKRRAI